MNPTPKVTKVTTVLKSLSDLQALGESAELLKILIGKLIKLDENYLYNKYEDFIKLSNSSVSEFLKETKFNSLEIFKVYTYFLDMTDLTDGLESLKNQMTENSIMVNEILFTLQRQLLLLDKFNFRSILENNGDSYGIYFKTNEIDSVLKKFNLTVGGK